MLYGDYQSRFFEEKNMLFPNKRVIVKKNLFQTDLNRSGFILLILGSLKRKKKLEILKIFDFVLIFISELRKYFFFKKSCEKFFLALIYFEAADM